MTNRELYYIPYAKDPVDLKNEGRQSSTNFRKYVSPDGVVIADGRSTLSPVRIAALMANKVLPPRSVRIPLYTTFINASKRLPGGNASGSRRRGIPRSSSHCGATP